jgi:predicted phosphodiesterase
MRIGIVSDLHAEFWKARDFAVMQSKLRATLAGSDIILLAGDIDHGDRAVDTAHTLFPDLPVFMVAGNHEFYGSDYDTVRARLTSKDNVRVLQQETIDLTPLGAPVRLIATTLWTDFNLMLDPDIAMFHASRTMNDFRLIQYCHRRLRPQDTLLWHNTERTWLLEQIKRPFAGKTIVMTHHAPAALAVLDPFIDDPLSPSFASRIEDDLIRYHVDLVVWGHTHQSVDRLIDQTRFLSNQTGYIRGDRSETGDYGQITEI